MLQAKQLPVSKTEFFRDIRKAPKTNTGASPNIQGPVSWYCPTCGFQRCVAQVFYLNTSVWSIGVWWISPCRANLGINQREEVPLRLGEKKHQGSWKGCFSHQDSPVKSSEFRSTSTQGWPVRETGSRVAGLWRSSCWYLGLGQTRWCWFRISLPRFHLVIFMWTSHSFSGVYMLAMMHCAWGAWYSI